MTYTTKDLIASFLEHWQYVKKRSPQTVRNYELYLQRFYRWSKISNPKTISSEIIKNYRTYLRATTFDGQRLNNSTINYHLIALRNWLKYLQLHDVAVPLNKKITLSKYLPTHRLTPSRTELTSLLSAPTKSLKDSKLTRARDQAIIATMIDSGWKVAIISNLQKNNLRGQQLRLEKGNTAPIGKQTQQLIKNYLQQRTDSSDWIFIAHDRAVNSRGQKKIKPMTPRSIQRLIKKYVLLAGIHRPLTADSFTKVKI